MSEFEYKIKKKRAVRVEKLPPPEMIEIYKNSAYSGVKTVRPSRGCVICGATSVYLAYFKLDRKGTQLLEKYCPACLDKWVIFDKSSCVTKAKAKPNDGSGGSSWDSTGD